MVDGKSRSAAVPSSMADMKPRQTPPPAPIPKLNSNPMKSGPKDDKAKSLNPFEDDAPSSNPFDESPSSSKNPFDEDEYPKDSNPFED